MRPQRYGFVCAALLFLAVFSNFFFARDRRPFTLADEIGLWLFIPDNGLDRPNATFSPDRKFFAVYSQRGRLDLNRPEYSLRFYRSAEVAAFLKQPAESEAPPAAWIISLATDKDGPIIQDWRWLPDSSGVVFLQRVSGKEQLVIGDLRKKKLRALTAGTESVENFEARDGEHFVYTAAAPEELKRMQERKQAERQAAAMVGTGLRLGQLILPDDPIVMQYSMPRACLWAGLGGKRFQVKRNGAPVFPEGDMVLSPDGRFLATTLAVPDVPPSWETLYPPPDEHSGSRIRAGHESAQEFVRIDLEKNSVQPLTNAPVSSAAGWPGGGSPVWSGDGERILLPGTFVRTKENASSRPCVAVVDVASGASSCVEELKAQGKAQEGSPTVSGVQFADGDKKRVLIQVSLPDGTTQTTEYREKADNRWEADAKQDAAKQNKAVKQDKDEATGGENGFTVAVKQGIDEPPLLIASTGNTSRVLWDPNPQLKEIELGPASVIRWKNKQGREFKGGLFKPFQYKAGQRYPLVIQTHGLYESFFFPSGPGMPTAFAARALAAQGIVVLQVDEDCPFGPGEGPCAVSAYESAVSKLVSEGLVDPEKIGIIGFSRTCYYVMEALTSSSLHFRAASITSGLMFDYWQYAMVPERGGGDDIIGAPPFGEGLQQWLKRSPGFNLDKVNTPLMIAGQGPDVLLSMWAAYSGLRQLHKPVELIMLNSDEHVLTNPGERMASQGGSVDWFRFWLQGYEDTDPAKAEQYARWRRLRELGQEKAAGKAM